MVLKISKKISFNNIEKISGSNRCIDIFFFKFNQEVKKSEIQEQFLQLLEGKCKGDSLFSRFNRYVGQNCLCNHNIKFNSIVLRFSSYIIE